MRKLFLIIATLSLFAQEDDGFIPAYTAIEQSAMPTGSINVITGTHSESLCDYVVNCGQPIPIQRRWAYSEDDAHVYGNAGFYLGQNHIDIWIGTLGSAPRFWLKEASGAVLTFYPGERWSFWDRSPVDSWTSRVYTRGICNTSSQEISGRTNIENHSLTCFHNQSKFVLTTGSGEKRTYQRHGRPNQSKYHHVHRRKNREPMKERFLLGETRLPNGNRLLYSYDPDGILTKITSTNDAKTNTLGWAQFTRTGKTIQVTTSDGRSFSYKLDGEQVMRFDPPGGRTHTYTYNTHGEVTTAKGERRSYIRQSPSRSVTLPEGREKKICFDGSHDRLEVASIKLPIGPIGNMEPWERYEYEGKWVTHRIPATDTRPAYDEEVWKPLPRTFLYDAEGNKTTFEWDAQTDRITQITRCDGCQEKRCWEGTKLTSRTLLSREGETLTTRTFTYDDSGNVLTETFQDFSKHYTYSDDGFNLTLSETDGDLTIHYTYKPGTNLLETRTTPFKEERFEYDENAALIFKEVISGPQHLLTHITNNEIGLPIIIEERAGDRQLRRTHLKYDDHNQVTQRTIFDATGQKRAILSTQYNEQGLPVREIDPLGQETSCTYDINGNRTSLKTPRQGVRTTYTYDRMNRLIATEKSDDQGNQFTNRITYDIMGRKTSVTDAIGHETRYEYDRLGNLIKEIHPATLTEEGFSHPTVLRTYDYLGNVLTETDENGFTTTYTYDPP
jgi:YD repeat-containing protein